MLNAAISHNSKGKDSKKFLVSTPLFLVFYFQTANYWN